jgi:nucleotide-binding universal stress UspA family protein
VLASIKRPDRADGVLAEAFSLAETRGARLRVLHAWQLPGGYDDMIAHHAVNDWDARARDELERAVAPWRAAHPGVDVEVRTVHDQPAHALVRASAEVDELVIVRKAHGMSHGVPAALHLGSTARAVMAHAHCPVRVVPADLRSPTPDLVLEDHGAMAK